MYAVCIGQGHNSIDGISAGYKLDFVGVQKFRWEGSHGNSRGLYLFSMGKEKKIISWGQNFFVHHRIVSAVKTVELAIGCYIALRGRWCNIIVMNVYAPSEEKR